MSPPTPISRRNLLSGSAALAAAAFTPGLLRADVPTRPAAASGQFQIPAENVPLTGDADVIVCGAGPAGVTAAITAARAGARVRLFEVHGCLGGVWTAGLLGYLLDFNKPGFNQELVRRLRERDAVRGQGMNGLAYEPEEMKLLLEELCVAAGVKFQLHTRVSAAFKEGRRLTTIVTDSKSGREAWRAPVFIDTTGDGDLGALAGCEFEIGEANNCPCQPMSMDALLVVKDANALKEFIHPVDGKSAEPAKKALLQAIQKAGFDPSYSKPTLFPIRDNLLLAMINHEYGVKPFEAAKVTEATVHARAELHRIIRGLRKLGGPWEGIQIAATPEQIGIRDGRRIRGRYVVGKQDVIAGARQEDAVVRPTFPVDIHALTLEHNKTAAYTNAGVKVKPYDIPLRAMIARDVDGLMMAGRCISGDFIAHASYRVTGNAVAMGEATGAVSAISASTKRTPDQVAWTEAASVLERTRSEK